VSFHEISIAVRAENRASYAFRTITMDAIHLAYSFGALDSQTGRMLTGVMTAIHLFTSLKAVLGTTTLAEMAHIAQTYITAAATWVLNASLAMKISLLTLGVGLIAVTAGYMAWLASTTRDAASAQSQYNEQVARAPYRSIRRGGEEELRNRGIEW